ncbi:hypothetical protein PESP_a3091 [Pseudoalteromonas espejiana DSM 9414]|uniref:Lipoprotein n=1 Tax=Pseudoalteromonas espejiana TaxID=28107 RepID=A0A510XU00_9GAMM|nr:hypothetical protein [Pseudoalteromonas espejiana]ASM50958.1 hypothetical protein PESP_a3091 [Pseudoalteromonas espejiana DSM 9414]GEK54091.1 hypothetical protein PES01_09360 [Pseudoalteromonas espejiana]
MRTRLIAILCVLSSAVVLAGCEINNTQKTASTEKVEPTNTKIKSTVPNPKVRPKSEPVYPSAEQVIAWHANQCGGFKIKPSTHTFLGEKELKSFFNYMCLNTASAPDEVMKKLQKLDLAYFWPDPIKQYLWLQKQHVTRQINAKKEQQALNDKMQQTLSSLATIEQQLLLREDTKEQ